MEVHFTAEQEARIAQKAARAGTDVEELVKNAVLRFIEAKTPSRQAAQELPVWDLGAIGPLHRSDIYDDAH